VTTTVSVDNPAIGYQLEPRKFGPVTRTDIVRYAGASGDFNPLHHDESFATAAGFPSIFSVGMFQAGLLATYVTDILGPRNIRKFTVRFVEKVWPGDVLTCNGTVMSATDESSGGKRLHVELSCARSDGGIAVAGTAIFVLQ
jgi:acyl dehydratase